MITLCIVVAVLIIIAIPTACWIDACSKLGETHRENVDLWFKVAGLEDDVLKLLSENVRLRGDVVHVPLLRSVPKQSAGEHDRLALSTEEWDAIWSEGKP